MLQGKGTGSNVKRSSETNQGCIKIGGRKYNGCGDEYNVEKREDYQVGKRGRGAEIFREENQDFKQMGLGKNIKLY